jgi:hypothetical protein
MNQDKVVIWKTYKSIFSVATAVRNWPNKLQYTPQSKLRTSLYQSITSPVVRTISFLAETK